LRYGLPGPDLYEYSLVARKYNFKLITVAGCIVDDAVRDSVNKHNKIAYTRLDKINGKDWQTNYEKDVRSTYSKDSTMIELLKNETFIKKRDAEQNKHGNGLIYLMDSALASEVYRINVIGYLDSTSTLVSFFRVYIDYRELTIVKKEENILPFEIEKKD